MASLGWSVYTWDGTNWNSDSTIPRPTQDMGFPLFHNQQKFQLADGDTGFVSPETKYVKEPLSMQFEYQEEAVVTKLNGYVTGDSYVKIETHVAGRDFIGRFISVNPVWLTGENPDRYDIDVVFERMEN
jgi:hypothetical protein